MAEIIAANLMASSWSRFRSVIMGWLAAIFIITLLATAAEAHRVTLFAWVEGGRVYMESRFSGGRTPKNSPVTVHDPAGNVLLTGTTDDHGRFSFPVPEAEGIRLVLSVGQGHRAEWVIPQEELAGADPITNAAPAVPAGPDTNRRASAPQNPARSAGNITATIQTAVRKEIAPLKAEITKLRRDLHGGPSLTDILGGIGYIIGLAGAAAYIGYRKRTTDIARHDR